MKFCNSPLSESEAERLRNAMMPLKVFLGSPGDWGYGTTLGNLTILLNEVRAAIPLNTESSNQPTGE